MVAQTDVEVHWSKQNIIRCYLSDLSKERSNRKRRNDKFGTKTKLGYLETKCYSGLLFDHDRVSPSLVTG